MKDQGSLAIGVLIFFVGITILLTGCSERQEVMDDIITEPADTADTRAVTIGEVKEESAPAAPQAPAVGAPSVQSVNYYSDWRLTKPLTGTVPAGKTIYIKVIFSEGMKLVVADDKTARPILYYRKAGKLTRFRIAKFGARGKDFVSGDAKPIKTQATYLCKYKVQPTDKGTFAFAVGKLSTDRQGNTLPAFYTHREKLQLGKSLPSPSNLSLVAAADSGVIGDNITNFTKVIITGKLTKAVPKGTQVHLYNNGVAVPGGVTTSIDRQNRWLAAVTLPEGVHTLTARSVTGRTVSADSEPLTLTIDTTPPTAKVQATLNDNTITMRVAGKDVVRYQYVVTPKGRDDNVPYSKTIPTGHPNDESVHNFYAGTLYLHVRGVDVAGNHQHPSTVVRLKKVTPRTDSRGEIAPPVRIVPDQPQQEPPVTTPRRRTPAPASEAEAERKAELLTSWIERKRRVIFQPITDAKQVEVIRNRWNTEVLAPLGMSQEFASKMFGIQYDGPNGVSDNDNRNAKWFLETVKEFLYLHFLYPRKSQEELLVLFKQSVQAGKTKITGIFWLPSNEELKEVDTLLPLSFPR